MGRPFFFFFFFARNASSDLVWTKLLWNFFLDTQKNKINLYYTITINPVKTATNQPKGLKHAEWASHLLIPLIAIPAINLNGSLFSKINK